MSRAAPTKPINLAEAAHALADHLRFLADLGCKGFDGASRSLEIMDQGWSRPKPWTPNLDDIESIARQCTLCPLRANRKNLVFGQGDAQADLLLVGLAPGPEEEAAGAPFQGEAGGLLDKILGAMGLPRNSIYLCNLMKCPCFAKPPEAHEMALCADYLKQQIQAVQPKIICTLGEAPSRVLLNSGEPLAMLRGRFHPYGGMRVAPTHHPSELLAEPQKKRAVWQDMQAIMRALGLKQAESRE